MYMCVRVFALPHLSTISRLDIGTVPTEWWILERFRQSVLFFWFH